jgi:hypothetical protein
MVAFYGISYAAGYVRGPRDFIWTFVAVIIGSVMGACGGFLVGPRASRPAIAVVAPSAMLLGETIWLVFERKLWRIDLQLESYRWTDVAIFGSLAVLTILLPFFIRTRTKISITYVSIVMLSVAGAAGLASLQWILLHV